MTHSTLEVQRRLHDLHYFPHHIDGIDGPRTRAAIRNFQISVRLPASGVLTAATEARLFPHVSRIGSLLAFMRELRELQAAKGPTTMDTIKAKSAIFSKINWSQGISMAAMLLSFFGFDLDAKTQAELLAAIIAVNGVFTWAMRTFFNNSVSPDLAGKTVTVQKA